MPLRLRKFEADFFHTKGVKVIYAAPDGASYEILAETIKWNDEEKVAVIKTDEGRIFFGDSVHDAITQALIAKYPTQISE